MKTTGFTFNRTPDELTTGGFDTALQPLAEAVADLIADQNIDVENMTFLMLTGARGAATITAAAGGVAVAFADIFGTAITFQRAPSVQLTMVGGAGAHAIVKTATTSTSGFTAQIYVAGVEQGAGSYTFNWLAVI